jgi:hypothetical protein
MMGKIVLLRLYLKFILPLALIFLVLSLAARALGATEPPNPALRGFTKGCEDKPQPCWYGIMPGITKIEDIPTILAKYRLKAELVYVPRYDHITYHISGLESQGNDCQIGVSSTNYSEYVYSIGFGMCSGVQLGQLRQFILSDGYAYLWKCNTNPDVLQINYRNIIFYIEDPSLVPPNNLAKVNVFTLHSDENIGDTKLRANGQSVPLRWRYLKVTTIESGCL